MSDWSEAGATRTYVVTGSAGGVGSAITELLEADGSTVLGIDIGNADVTCDLADPESRNRGLAEAVERVDGPLGGLVVCAGVGTHIDPPSVIARVNHFGAIATLETFRPLLAQADDAACVVVGSNSASFAPPETPLIDIFLGGDEESAAAAADAEDGALVYAAAKRALTVATRRMSPKWAEDSIRLNVVAPGPVDTALLQGGLEHPTHGDAIRALPVPLNRWGDRMEVARIIHLLLGPLTAFVHGSVWFIDGGTDALARPDSF